MTTATKERERQQRLASYQERSKYPCLPLTPEQQRLVSENHKLAYSYLDRKMPYVRREEREDVISILFEFLVRAAQCFDPGRGLKFTTYAFSWFNAARSRWHQGLMYDARIPTNRVSEMTEDEVDGVYFGIADRKAVMPESTAEINDALDRYRAFVVDPRRWQVLEWRFRDGLSLSQIGAELSLSKERVRQLIEGTLVRIREAVRRERLGQRELFKAKEEAEEEPTAVRHIGRCPNCRRIIMWRAGSTARIEAAGLIAEVMTGEQLREKTWGHGAGCSRRKRKRRREERTMFEVSEN